MNSLNAEQVKEAFIRLGYYLKELLQTPDNDLYQQAMNKNPWFIKDNIVQAIEGIINYTEKENLDNWLKNYNMQFTKSANVGILMAGNIPLVGFHDLLSVLICGHRAIIKLSSQDDVLLPFIINKLISIEPLLAEKIEFREQLNNIDAVIATGSNNSARYFHYYFSKIPHIIRKNRNSCAILSGNESKEDLTLLGKDIFSYFGLGCRNVTKIYIPENYDFTLFKKAFEPWNYVINHHKYANNYDYQKTILLMNLAPHMDGQHFLLVENEKHGSPVSVIHYEIYHEINKLKSLLAAHSENLQCIASNIKEIENAVPLGKTQQPDLWDYADNVDTLKFLLQLHKNDIN